MRSSALREGTDNHRTQSRDVGIWIFMTGLEATRTLAGPSDVTLWNAIPDGSACDMLMLSVTNVAADSPTTTEGDT